MTDPTPTVSEAIATVTLTPTTKSGRTASSPKVGSIRTLIMSTSSLVVTGFLSWATGAIEVTPEGVVITLKFAALGGLASTVLLAGVDYLRRKAADKGVEETHA
jgi:hypothetical protein